jgi:hypothetical protein
LVKRYDFIKRGDSLCKIGFPDLMDFSQRGKFSVEASCAFCRCCPVGWVDIGTGTNVPLRFVTYLSKVTKINEKSVFTQ